jgi:hypothetical protein
MKRREKTWGAAPPAHFVTPSAQLPSLRSVQPVPREAVTPFAPPAARREAEEQRGLFLAEQRAKTMTGNIKTASDFRNTILNGDSV